MGQLLQRVQEVLKLGGDIIIFLACGIISAAQFLYIRKNFSIIEKYRKYQKFLNDNPNPISIKEVNE